jgi:hypothetical protein
MEDIADFKFKVSDFLKEILFSAIYNLQSAI